MLIVITGLSRQQYDICNKWQRSSNLVIKGHHAVPGRGPTNAEMHALNGNIECNICLAEITEDRVYRGCRNTHTDVLCMGCASLMASMAPQSTIINCPFCREPMARPLPPLRLPYMEHIIEERDYPGLLMYYRAVILNWGPRTNRTPAYILLGRLAIVYDTDTVAYHGIHRHIFTFHSHLVELIDLETSQAEERVLQLEENFGDAEALAAMWNALMHALNGNTSTAAPGALTEAMLDKHNTKAIKHHVPVVCRKCNNTYKSKGKCCEEAAEAGQKLESPAKARQAAKRKHDANCQKINQAKIKCGVAAFVAESSQRGSSNSPSSAGGSDSTPTGSGGPVTATPKPVAAKAAPPPKPKVLRAKAKGLSLYWDWGVLDTKSVNSRFTVDAAGRTNRENVISRAANIRWWYNVFAIGIIMPGAMAALAKAFGMLIQATDSPIAWWEAVMICMAAYVCIAYTLYHFAPKVPLNFTWVPSDIPSNYHPDYVDLYNEFVVSCQTIKVTATNKEGVMTLVTARFSDLIEAKLIEYYIDVADANFCIDRQVVLQSKMEWINAVVHNLSFTSKTLNEVKQRHQLAQMVQNPDESTNPLNRAGWF